MDINAASKKIVFNRKDAGVSATGDFFEIKSKDHPEQVKDGVEVKGDDISITVSTKPGTFDVDIIHPRIPDLECNTFNSKNIGDGRISAVDASLILQIASAVAKDCRGHSVGYLEINKAEQDSLGNFITGKDGSYVYSVPVFERKLIDLDRIKDDWGEDISRITQETSSEYKVIIEPVFNKYQTWRADASWDSFDGGTFLPITIYDALLVETYAAYRGAGDSLTRGLSDESEKDWGKFLKLVENEKINIESEYYIFYNFFPAVIDINKITKEDYDIIQIAVQQKKNEIAFEESILSQYNANPNWEQYYNNGNILKIKFHNFDLIKHFLNLCELKTLIKPQGYCIDEEGNPYGTFQGWKDYIQREFTNISDDIDVNNMEFIFSDENGFSKKSITSSEENNQITSITSGTSYKVEGVGNGINITTELGSNVKNDATSMSEINLSLKQRHSYSVLGELLNPINYQYDALEDSDSILQSRLNVYLESPCYYLRGIYNYELDGTTLLSQSIEISEEDKANVIINMPSLNSTITNKVEVIDPLPKLRSFSMYVKNDSNEWTKTISGSTAFNTLQSTGVVTDSEIPIEKQLDIIGRPLYLNSGNNKGIISYHIDRLGRLSNELIGAGRRYYHKNETTFNPATEEYLKIELAFNGVPNEDYQMPQISSYTSNESPIYWSCQLNDLKANNHIEIVETGITRNVVSEEVSPNSQYITTGKEIAFYCVIKVKGNIDTSTITQEDNMTITQYYDQTYRENLYSQITYPLVFTFRHETEESPNGETINFGEKIYIDLLLEKKEV